MLKQQIIRDNNYNIIEEYDNSGNHIKYNNNGKIIYYKIPNFEYPFTGKTQTTILPQEQEFIYIIKEAVIEIDKVSYSDSIYFFKNYNFLFEYNLNYGEIWFNYELIWEVFETEYSMNYEQVQVFMKDMVGRHFNCKDITPFFIRNKITLAVEKHFNCK